MFTSLSNHYINKTVKKMSKNDLNNSTNYISKSNIIIQTFASTLTRFHFLNIFDQSKRLFMIVYLS